MLDWFPNDESAAVAYQKRAVHIPEHPEHYQVLEVIESVHASDNREVELADLVRLLVDRGAVECCPRGSDGDRDGRLTRSLDPGLEGAAGFVYTTRREAVWTILRFTSPRS